MRKAFQIFYALFLLSFISQINYSGTGDFLYAGTTTISNAKSAKGLTNDKWTGLGIEKIAKASKHTYPKSVIRIKALTQSSFLAISPAFNNIGIQTFPAHTPCFSFYKSYIAFGICSSNLLRGPPVYIV
jgi:hypothetical protein